MTAALYAYSVIIDLGPEDRADLLKLIEDHGPVSLVQAARLGIDALTEQGDLLNVLDHTIRRLANIAEN